MPFKPFCAKCYSWHHREEPCSDLGPIIQVQPEEVRKKALAVYPVPWRVEPHRTDKRAGHVVDAHGVNVMTSIDRGLAEVIVESVNSAASR